MDAQKLIDTAHDPFLPRELWDMVEIPAPPAPEPVNAPALAPELEVVDLPEQNEQPAVTDVRPELGRLAGRLENVGMAAALVGVACMITLGITQWEVFLWLGGFASGIGVGVVIATAKITKIIRKNVHVKGS